MKKLILEACATAFTLLGACAASAATSELAACDASGKSSPCITVAVHTEADGLRPAVMRATMVVPSREDIHPPARDHRLPEPGGWATLLAGLFGALAIARRRVS